LVISRAAIGALNTAMMPIMPVTYPAQVAV